MNTNAQLFRLSELEKDQAIAKVKLREIRDLIRELKREYTNRLGPLEEIFQKWNAQLLSFEREAIPLYQGLSDEEKIAFRTGLSVEQVQKGLALLRTNKEIGS